ncbi:MAG: hypothetical protein AAF354_14540 [Pseudomonadota bacterium]
MCEFHEETRDTLPVAGHLSGDYRDAFPGAIDAFEQWDESSQPEPEVELNGRFVPITLVPGLLWNSTDIMPRALCEQLEKLLPPGELCEQGSTYAQGARCIKSVMQKQ